MASQSVPSGNHPMLQGVQYHLTGKHHINRPPVQLLLHGKPPSGRENSYQHPNFSFSKINWEQNIYSASQIVVSPVHCMCLEEPLDRSHRRCTLPSCCAMNSMRLSLLYKHKFDILLCYSGRYHGTKPTRAFHGLPGSAAISLLTFEWPGENKISGAIYGCRCC